METTNTVMITVDTVISAPLQKVWEYFTLPRHIVKWNYAVDDWHTPRAENDLRTGGRFLSRMEARDGSFGFDFTGTYTDVQPLQSIAYVLDDGRKVTIRFEASEGQTKLSETFEAENHHSAAQQKTGWQSILNHFRDYVEQH